MSKILILSCLIVLFSCKEESTNTKTVFQNKSGHSIEVRPYIQGRESIEDVKIIANNESIVILDKDNRGKGTGFTYPKYILSMDSVEVIFDGTVKAVHYSENIVIGNPKALGYANPRNIYNEANYIRKITSEDKNNIYNEYTFVFTEQDYLNANN
jgi:hypothetical protein